VLCCWSCSSCLLFSVCSSISCSCTGHVAWIKLVELNWIQTQMLWLMLYTLNNVCIHCSMYSRRTSQLGQFVTVLLLAVQCRIEFKLATLHDTTPPYLSDDGQLVSNADRRLCSSAALSCVVPRTRTRLGDRSFDVAGPRIWIN